MSAIEVSIFARAQIRRYRRNRPLLCIAAVLLGTHHIAIAADATEQTPGAQETPAQQHYDEAFRLQQEGDLARADAEHKAFLADSLHHIANARANVGKYASAVPLYDQALKFMPDNVDLNLDYAGAALDGFDWETSKKLASATLELLKEQGQPANPTAISLLAQAMMGKGEYKEAVEQFRILAQVQPGFGSSYALAGAYLALGDKASAASIFREMPLRFADTAAMHLKIGRLYGQATFYDDAVQEFKTAIAKDDHLPGAHFSLGATYMMRSGELSYNDAEPELRKELTIDPGQPLVYVALGRIDVVQHRNAEAEASLTRAIELDPQSTAAYALLGQLFTSMGRLDDAEAAFRKQIALTLIPAKNEYEVERAHFCLGRLLLQRGQVAEGRKELQISRDLLDQKAHQTESRLHGNAALKLQAGKTHEATPEDLEMEKTLESQAGPPMASSYDSLGVHAAKAGDFEAAADYFKRAAQWDSALGGIHHKWGRAAFAAGDYAAAVAPLSRALAVDPADEDVRQMLGVSLFQTHNYPQAYRVLQPIEAGLEPNTSLGLAYVGSMAIAGDPERGTAQLLALEKANPNSEDIHRLLGEAYAGRKLYEPATRELRIALRLVPSSAPAKYALALADIAIGQKSDARRLLSELANSGSKDDAVYYRLGCLQLESGLTRAAVVNLETAIKISPANVEYHRKLAEAYRRNEQPQQAEMELQKLATMETQAAPATDEKAPF